MAPRPQSDAPDRILRAAFQLFYEKGYQATTMDQIIELAGVSKPTAYAHYPTKEALCVAYLREKSDEEIDNLKAAVARYRSPHRRFMAVIEHIREVMIDADFRGCAFFNMVAEIHDQSSEIVKIARVHVDRITAVIADVAAELQASGGDYAELDVDQLTKNYYLIVCGAIMASQEYRDRWPTDQAVEVTESLLAR